MELDDIKYAEEQLEWINNPAELRAGVIFPNRKWPEATVPYTISSSLPEDQSELIPQALQMIQDATCIKFVERTTEKNYVEILRKKPGSCWSRLGYIGKGRQELNLGDWNDGNPCAMGTVVHEMMHTLGIEHEQNRPDQDDHITVDFSKISKDKRSQYEKNDPTRRSTYDLPYAFDSIMHYPLYSNGEQIMFPKTEVNVKVGQRDHLAPGDIGLMKAMYSCS